MATMPFSYYKIYRKPKNSGSFALISGTEPFIYLAPNTENNQTIGYVDTVFTDAELTQDFEYKVEGVTFFGQSIESAVITANPRPYIPPQYFRTDTVTYLTNSAKLKWTIDPLAAPHVDSFFIYTKMSIEGNDTYLTQLAGTAREYTVPASSFSKYYIIAVRLKKNYGSQTSEPILVQFTDTIPPTKPATPSGIFDRSGNLQIRWKGNTEPDLEGYTVWYALKNDATTVYTALFSIPQVDTVYEGFIDPMMIADTVFIKIAAMDFRGNISPLSNAAVILRPGSEQFNPKINQINPRPAGQRISWVIPTSTKGQKLIIERRPSALIAWTKVKEFILPATIDSIARDTNDRFTMYYIDTAKLEKIDYDYRLNYFTTNGENNFSEIYTIRPYDDGFRGSFSSVSLQSLGASSSTMQTIGLGWDYNTGYEATLEEFKIYIRNPAKDDAFYLYNTVKINKSQAPANSPNQASSSAQGSRYSTRAQVSKGSAGANFATSGIQYKIVAIHRDGGQTIYIANGNNTTFETK
jgi:hypothetical protein